LPASALRSYRREGPAAIAGAGIPVWEFPTLPASGMPGRAGEDASPEGARRNSGDARKPRPYGAAQRPRHRLRSTSWPSTCTPSRRPS
jgi:hypothetical protein